MITSTLGSFRWRCDSGADNIYHSGGEEVLLDVGGQDATEAFEDVGHSDEAREILDGLLVGEVKRAVSEFSHHFHHIATPFCRCRASSLKTELIQFILAAGRTWTSQNHSGRDNKHSNKDRGCKFRRRALCISSAGGSGCFWCLQISTDATRLEQMKQMNHTSHSCVGYIFKIDDSFVSSYCIRGEYIQHSGPFYSTPVLSTGELWHIWPSDDSAGERILETRLKILQHVFEEDNGFSH